MPHPEKQTHRKTTITKANTRLFLILFIIIIKLVRLAPPAISRHEECKSKLLVIEFNHKVSVFGFQVSALQVS